MHTAKVAGGIFRLQLEAGSHGAAGGIVLKADQGETRTAAFEPVMAAGIGEKHQAEAGPAWTAGTILTRTALLGRRSFGLAQNAAHALPAQGKAFVLDQLLPQMRIIEAGILGRS